MDTSERLREAAKDSVFHAVATQLSQRSRARDHITVYALTREMQQEGFKYEEAQIAEVLETLSEIGIGTLKHSAEGFIEALVDIRVALKSVGEAALRGTSLKDFQKRQRHNTKSAPQRAQASRPTPPKDTGPWLADEASMVLTVKIGGRPINIPVPRELSSDQVSELVGKFRTTKAR